MKKEDEEKKPIPWEVTDPKPPVIQSGHMERRVAGRHHPFSDCPEAGPYGF